ncbi:MAG: hypothetical protein HQL68_04325 [Magnetococcales bacterium]|nr:hypothetical protein [Magnetococcales bacterium]
MKREFHATVKKMAGHGLGLVLLGNLLAQRYGGDIAKNDQIDDLFIAGGAGEHAKQVMQHYEDKLWQKDGKETVFLPLLGLFDRPMDVELFKQLQEKAEVAHGLQNMADPEINQMVGNLEHIGLILHDKTGVVGERTEYDAHPLVREYFGQKFEKEEPKLFRQAHRVFFFCLMSLGRMTEAVRPRRGQMQISEKLEDWLNAANAATNLVDLLLATGSLLDAEKRAKQGIEWAGKTADKYRQLVNHSQLATTLHRLGKMEASQEFFQKAEGLQGEDDPQKPQLYALQGARYCALMLEQAQSKADYGVVLQRAQDAQKIALKRNHLLAIAFDELTIARSQTLLGETRAAQIAFDAAVDGIRKAGKIEFLPDFLNHRANFRRQQGEQEKGQHDLDAALETAVRCGLLLYEADGRLLQCHYLLDEGKLKEAGVALERAEKLIEQMSYGQKIVEMYIARARFEYHNGNGELAKKTLQLSKERITEIGQFGLRGELERVGEEIGF